MNAISTNSKECEILRLAISGLIFGFCFFSVKANAASSQGIAVPEVVIDYVDENGIHFSIIDGMLETGFGSVGSADLYHYDDLSYDYCTNSAHNVFGHLFSTSSVLQTDSTVMSITGNYGPVHANAIAAIDQNQNSDNCISLLYFKDSYSQVFGFYYSGPNYRPESNWNGVQTSNYQYLKKI